MRSFSRRCAEIAEPKVERPPSGFDPSDLGPVAVLIAVERADVARVFAMIDQHAEPHPRAIAEA